MKIIDRFVLKSFIRPFLITFFVMILFLLMQFLWKYIDDLVGRGVEWYYIAELLFYTSATVIPMALPLAVLLSSIMVLGTLGENNELAALKSSGHSLIRVMRPLIFFIVLLSIGAFLTANYVIPVANFKSSTLLKNIRNAKPALSIQPGVFYSGIEHYAIKVGEKYGPNQNLLRDVIIYDHQKQQGNLKVVKADSGKMEVTDDELYLNIYLYQGKAYEEYLPSKRKDRDNHPLMQTEFDESLMRFNLADFQTGDLRESGRKEFDMLSIAQLKEAVDSLHLEKARRMRQFQYRMQDRYRPVLAKDDYDAENLPLAADSARLDTSRLDTVQWGLMDTVAGTYSADRELSDSLILNHYPEERLRITQNALRIARSSKAYYSNATSEYQWRNSVITRHLLEWQKKFSVSFAVIVLFFIGAPLGAIIRKGGMGMPVVISVVIFIIYHVTSFSLEKVGRHMILDPVPAMWLANWILLPIGIWLTYKSASDSVIFNAELYLRPFQKISSIFASRKKKSA